MAQIPVALFNANTLAVQVQVNGGAPFGINGTSDSIDWIPQQPVTDPGYSNQGPGPNVFGPGDNSLQATPAGVTKPMYFTVKIPGTIQIISLQLYFYWNSAFTVSWYLLNNGQFLATSETLRLGHG
jgi:hypothetical protein